MQNPFINTLITGALWGGIPGTAMSQEALSVLHHNQTITQSFESSESLFGLKSQTLSELVRLFQEHQDVDWDGEGALPVSNLAAANTINFIKMLPNGYPMPEFAAETDGSVELDWIRDKHHLFSLSIGEADRLPFAWISGSDRGSGVVRFSNGNIPVQILNGIQTTMEISDVGYGFG